MKALLKATIVLVILFLPSYSFGQDEWLTYKTLYLTVRYKNLDDFAAFEKDVRGGISFLQKTHGPDSSFLANKIDTIYEKVEYLLDMYPSGKQNIVVEVYANNKDVQDRCTKLGLRGGPHMACYYLNSPTILVSVDNLDTGIFAHELTHAIITACTNPSLPSKTQEILAQYVDAHISF